jgi:phage shock protein A
VRGELEKTIDKIESSIENLLIRKSEVEKSIRTYSDQNAQTKRQVQSAFEEVKAKLALKEKEILGRLDQDLNEAVDELEKSIKTIIKKIEDLKGYSSATSDVMKREDVRSSLASS